MRVLVTGATGFLGGAVARRFHGDGHSVLATGRDLARGARLADAGVPFVQADLADAAAAASLCAGQDVVVHCAALSSPWGAYEAFYGANVVVTQRLADAAVRRGVPRFVHISTPSLYMGGGSRQAVREDDPLPPPVNAYAATKRLAERVVDVARQRGLQTIVLRPRALFGPGDTTVFPRLVRGLRDGRLPIVGDGTNVVDLTYIENAVDAVALACAAPQAAWGGTYNVTNGEPVPLWPLLGDLARLLGFPLPVRRLSRPAALAVARVTEAVWRMTRRRTEPMLTRYAVYVLSDTMTLDISRARQSLGYQPRVSVRDGLERFVRSLESAS